MMNRPVRSIREITLEPDLTAIPWLAPGGRPRRDWKRPAC
jgi:hypothetical protein